MTLFSNKLDAVTAKMALKMAKASYDDWTISSAVSPIQEIA